MEGLSYEVDWWNPAVILPCSSRVIAIKGKALELFDERSPMGVSKTTSALREDIQRKQQRQMVYTDCKRSPVASLVHTCTCYTDVGGSRAITYWIFGVAMNGRFLCTHLANCSYRMEEVSSVDNDLCHTFWTRRQVACSTIQQTPRIAHPQSTSLIRTLFMVSCRLHSKSAYLHLSNWNIWEFGDWNTCVGFALISVWVCACVIGT